jgi:hypothetical protein
MLRRLRELLNQHPRLLIFVVALLFRLLFGAICCGSIDLINCLIVTPQLLANHRLEEVPYLPGVSTFIFLGGVIALKTPLPISLGYKIFPIFFDSLLAVLIRDVVSRRSARTALAAGLLYALSPVAMLIVCCQAQWDPIWIFFVVLAFHVREDFPDSHGKYLLFGAFFGASILFKPIALLLLPFFFSAASLRQVSRRELLYQASAVAGLAGIGVLACVLFTLAGYSMIERLRTIAGYSANGVIMFGLPFAFPLNQLPFLRSRLWLMGAIIALALPYSRCRLDVFSAALVAFLIVLGTAGLSPQYLLWPIPFLLLSRRLVVAAFCNVFFAVFLFLFYLNPLASYYPAENMSTFALLVPLRWAMPPAAWTDAHLMPVIQLLGNYAIPLFLLGAVWHVLTSARAQGSSNENARLLPLASLWPLYGRVLFFGGLATVALRMLLSFTPEMAAAFTPVFVFTRLDAYSLKVMSALGPIVGLYPEKSVFHLGWVVLIGALAWSVVAVWLASERSFPLIPSVSRPVPISVTDLADAGRLARLSE